MDLWSAFGISRQAGWLAVPLGLLAALVMAGGIALRRRSGRRNAGLGLDDR
jgi:hypothetical protein